MITLLFLGLFVAVFLVLFGVFLAALPIAGRGPERSWQEIGKRRAWPLPDPTAVRPDRFPASVKVTGLRPGQSVHLTMHPMMITESATVTPHPPGFRWDGTPQPPRPLTFDPAGLCVYTVDAVGGVAKHPITDPQLQSAVRAIAAAQQRRREAPERPAVPLEAVDIADVWEKLGHPDLAQHERYLRAVTRGICPEHHVRGEDGVIIPTPTLGCPRCVGESP